MLRNGFQYIRQTVYKVKKQCINNLTKKKKKKTFKFYFVFFNSRPSDSPINKNRTFLTQNLKDLIFK